MKYLVPLFVFFSCAWPPGAGLCQEAQTLNELIQRYDASRCQECHQEIYAAWEQSLHAKPLIGPIGRTLATFQGYIKSRDTELKKSREAAPTMKAFIKPCVECHLPQMMDASEAVVEEIAEAIVDDDEDILTQLRITCIVCHHRNAIIRKFRDGLPQPGAVYGPHYVGEHEDTTFTRAEKSEMMRDTVFCAQCHQGPNVQHYNEPMWCTSTFDSHQHFYVPMGGTESCQSCHMADEDGHRFPPNYQNKEQTSKRLQQWIDLSMNTLGYRTRTVGKELKPMVVINTQVTSRIGHRFPDGCPSPNRVTLDIVVTAENGTQLYQETKPTCPSTNWDTTRTPWCMLPIAS